MTRESPKLDSPAYLVLGMVRLGARSGYEIKQAVEISLRFFWTISPAQIYPSLERLEQSRSIQPAALSNERDGNVYPMLTLQMGIAFHQAMLDVCSEFEQKFFAARRRATRRLRKNGGRVRA